VRVFDPRLVLFAGGVVLVGALSWMGRLSPATGAPQLFWPLVVRAIGSGLMFLPLNLAAIGPIPREDISKATGFFNLTRQLGGSIGVALLSTILDRRMAFHRSVLVSHVTDIDPNTHERIAQLSQMFSSQGASAQLAHARALATLDGAVMRQASILSFNDTFFVTASLVLAILPLVLLLGRPKPAADLSGTH
jgi:DHA2 family multidrug resistance protein